MTTIRHNGKCRTCLRPVSVGMVFRSRIMLSTIGLGRLVDDSQPKRAILPTADCVIVDADGFYRPAAAAGQTAFPLVVCCGRAITMQPVRGRLAPEHKCDARCEGARGHNCECSCGGANHGKAHSA